MNCLLALFAACLFDPSHLSIEAGSHWQVGGQFSYYLAEGTYQGAIGELKISMDVPVTSTLEIRYGLVHRSYLETNSDRGDESAFLGLTWKPFRR